MSARLLLVAVAALGCGDRGTADPAGKPPPEDGAPAASPPAAAPATPPDAFAPLRRVGAEWRYQVAARRKQALEPVAGITVVLRVADVVSRRDHALVTLAGRIEPEAAQAPPELARQIGQPLRFVLLADGLVELLPSPEELRVDHAAASLADREVRDGDIMLPARFVDGWRIAFAAKDANGEATLTRSRRTLGGSEVEVWTLAWASEVALPPLRKRPWRWRKLSYAVEYSPEVGFVTLDGLDADFVLRLRE